MAESLIEDEKDPEWLDTSEPVLAGLNRSLTLRKCPAHTNPISCFSDTRNKGDQRLLCRSIQMTPWKTAGTTNE
jgi:hypothetical protein